MKYYKIIVGIFIVFLAGLAYFWNSSTCYLNGVVCQKNVEYAQKPRISLYESDASDKDGFTLVKLPNDKKGFYISAEEEGGVLYAAYQVYQNDYSCPVHSYIEPAKVDYKVEFFKIELSSNKELTISTLQESVPNTLKTWRKSQKIDKSKQLICEDGVIGYSTWKRKF